MRHGHGQRGILAGDDRQPFIGLGRGGGQARIDRRDRRLIAHVAPEMDGVRHLTVGRDRIGPPAQNVIRRADVVVAIIPQTFGVIGAELLALGADGRVADIVGRADDLGHRGIEHVAHVGVAAAIDREALGLAGVAQLDDLVGQRADRLVPRDRDKARILVAALARVGPLERLTDAVGVIDLLQREVRARADLAERGLGVGVAAQMHRAPVHHLDLHRAPRGAALAGGGFPFADLLRRRLRLGRRELGQRGDGECRGPGTAQEVPARDRPCFAVGFGCCLGHGGTLFLDGRIACARRVSSMLRVWRPAREPGRREQPRNGWSSRRRESGPRRSRQGPVPRCAWPRASGSPSRAKGTRTPRTTPPMPTSAPY